MTTCLGKSCSIGLLCVSFVNVYKILCVCPSFPFGIKDGMWDVIVLIPDHCLSIYVGGSGRIEDDMTIISEPRHAWPSLGGSSVLVLW